MYTYMHVYEACSYMCMQEYARRTHFSRTTFDIFVNLVILTSLAFVIMR